MKIKNHDLAFRAVKKTARLKPRPRRDINAMRAEATNLIDSLRRRLFDVTDKEDMEEIIYRLERIEVELVR